MDLLPDLAVFSQIVVIDIALAGDNAMAIGLAASGLPPEQRHKAMVRGIIVAAVLRILFAVCAVSLLHIAGLLAVGGLLLLWVAWKMFGEIRHARRMHGQKAVTIAAPIKTLTAAVIQIAIADISMSLDNVLAVAGIARDRWIPLVLGLVLSVVLMGAAAALVARLITRHRWISWLALAIVVYTAGLMIWQGAQQLRGIAV